MAIRSKTFPFPYYANFTNDYKDVGFETNWSIDSTDSESSFRVNVNLGNGFINSLVSSKKVGLCCLVVSKNTGFRNVLNFKNGERSLAFSINNSNIDEQTIMTVYLVAKEQFVLSSDSFDDFFSGTNYQIEKGNVIGESEDQSYFAHHRDSRSGTAIFTRSFSNAMKDDDAPKIEYQQDTIKLVMPKSMYDYLNRAEGKPKNYPAIHAEFLVPALAQTIAMMASSNKDDSDSFYSQHKNDKWFTLIEEKIGPIDDFPQSSAWTKAQEILGKPVNKAIQTQINEKKDRPASKIGEAE